MWDDDNYTEAGDLPLYVSGGAYSDTRQPESLDGDAAQPATPGDGAYSDARQPIAPAYSIAPLYNGGIKPADDPERQDSIHIADEVITQIISLAAVKIDGVSLPSAGVGDGIAGFLGMKGSARGIRIETDGGDIAVDISVTAEYGVRITDAAKSLQDAIRDDLTEMTGLNVTRVSVHVLSINTKNVKND
jgi:uncharacterized alkaline shock family protein YloU